MNKRMLDKCMKLCAHYGSGPVSLKDFGTERMSNTEAADLIQKYKSKDYGRKRLCKS